MTQAEHSILLKLTMAAGSLRSCAERPRVLLSESSKDSSSNGSVSSRLSFLFAQGHNTCRAPMEFATLTLPYLFKHLQIFFFGGGEGGCFSLFPSIQVQSTPEACLVSESQSVPPAKLLALPQLLLSVMHQEFSPLWLFREIGLHLCADIADYLLPTSNKLCGLLFFKKVLLALSFQE